MLTSVFVVTGVLHSGAPSRIFFFFFCCLSGCVHTVRASCLNLCFSPALCARPRCQSPAPPSPPPPPPPAPASGGARTDRPAPPGRVRPHRCRTSTRTTRDSVGLRTHPRASQRRRDFSHEVIGFTRTNSAFSVVVLQCTCPEVPALFPSARRRRGLWRRRSQNISTPTSKVDSTTGQRSPGEKTSLTLKRSVLTRRLRLSVSPPDAW